MEQSRNMRKAGRKYGRMTNKYNHPDLKGTFFFNILKPSEPL
jgi:hypothetical protein